MTPEVALPGRPVSPVLSQGDREMAKTKQQAAKKAIKKAEKKSRPGWVKGNTDYRGHTVMVIESKAGWFAQIELRGDRRDDPDTLCELMKPAVTQAVAEKVLVDRLEALYRFDAADHAAAERRSRASEIANGDKEE